MLSLKRLKFMFGQKSKIAQAVLEKITRGKVIARDDTNGTLEFYYTLSDCLVTLRQLNYASDLYSSDTLRLAVQRLPKNLQMKWAENSLKIRDRWEEPNLIHLEAWLERRVLVQKDAYVSEPREQKNQSAAPKSKEKITGATFTDPLI